MHLCMHDHVSSMSWASTLLIVYRMNSITVCIQFPWQLSQLTTSDLSRPSASPRPWPQVSRMAPSHDKIESMRPETQPKLWEPLFEHIHVGSIVLVTTAGSGKLFLYQLCEDRKPRIAATSSATAKIRLRISTPHKIGQKHTHRMARTAPKAKRDYEACFQSLQESNPNLLGKCKNSRPVRLIT